MLHYGDFATYEFAMTTDAMTPDLFPKQTPDTDTTMQNAPLSNEQQVTDPLSAESLTTGQGLRDHDTLLDDELSLDSDVDDAINEDLDDDDDAIDDDDTEQDVVGSAGQAALLDVIDMTHTVIDKEAGLRIDKLASQVFTDFSRAQLQGWITDGSLLYNGQVQKSKQRCKVGDTLHLSTTLQQHSKDLPENIDIDVVYEDDAVLVINKPVGMVVHPGAGNQTGTLVNALLYHYPQQHHLPRAGLVHRIDKDTSGLLLIGKTKPAQMALMAQLKDKSVYRHYQCVVAGDQASLMRHRRIDAPIGRHRNQRTKMAVMTAGRDAVTHLLDVTALNDNYCLLDVGLETGRTHQIRVHLSHISHPLVGDRIYGGRRQLRAGLTEQQRNIISNFSRQALHAYALGFVHPTTGEDIEVTTPIPEDMQQLIVALSDGYEDQ